MGGPATVPAERGVTGAVLRVSHSEVCSFGWKGSGIMSAELQLGKLSEHRAETPREAVGLPQSVVDQIRLDSAIKSDEYLDETTVPHGGE